MRRWRDGIHSRALGGGFFQLAHMHLAALEFDFAVDEGEEGVVSAAADVEAGVELGAALANDDGACGNDLSAVGFYATILRVAVATVAGRAGAFFMCHKSPGSIRESRHPTTKGGRGRFTGVG